MSLVELLVIFVVGLLVVGPDRLPEAIRNGMLWFGRIKRAINDTRVEFEQQLGVDDIRRELQNEQVMQSLKALDDAQKAVADEADDFEKELQKEIKHIEDNIDEPVPHPEPVSTEQGDAYSGDSVNKTAKSSDT